MGGVVERPPSARGPRPRPPAEYEAAHRSPPAAAVAYRCQTSSSNDAERERPPPRAPGALAGPGARTLYRKEDRPARTTPAGCLPGTTERPSAKRPSLHQIQGGPDRQDAQPLDDPADAGPPAHPLVVPKRRAVELTGPVGRALVDGEVGRVDPLPRPRPGIARLHQARRLREQLPRPRTVAQHADRAAEQVELAHGAEAITPSARERQTVLVPPARRGEVARLRGQQPQVVEPDRHLRGRAERAGARQALLRAAPGLRRPPLAGVEQRQARQHDGLALPVVQRREARRGLVQRRPRPLEVAVLAKEVPDPEQGPGLEVPRARCPGQQRLQPPLPLQVPPAVPPEPAQRDRQPQARCRLALGAPGERRAQVLVLAVEPPQPVVAFARARPDARRLASASVR